MGNFLMPSLGADMDVGTIVEWRVQPRDVVHRGDIVAVVDTEKSDIEVEIFEDGVVESVLVDVGREVAVNTPLARIAPATPAVESPPAAALPAPEVAPRAAPTPAPRKTSKRAAARKRDRTPPKQGVERHVRASPLARLLADERGAELAAVTGSGPGGAVLAADVPVHSRGPGTPRERPLPREPAERQAAMRHAVGELMARSKREIPHYYLATTIDLALASAWLADQNARRLLSERLLPAALFLKATALAARRVPGFSGFWRGGYHAEAPVHLGVTVSLRGGGLVGPAIHDADFLTVHELMAALRDLVQRSRTAKLRSSEMSDPTLTVTNLGDQGAEEVHGVIYPPQVALVGFGKVIERPWAVGGLLGVRPTVRATLAADHRVTNGHDGSRFLATIDDLLQGPEEL